MRDKDEEYRDYIKSVGIKVRLARLKSKLKLQDLAAAIGFHRTGLTNIERGHKACSIGTIKRIADALNKDVKEFL